MDAEVHLPDNWETFKEECLAVHDLPKFHNFDKPTKASEINYRAGKLSNEKKKLNFTKFNVYKTNTFAIEIYYKVFGALHIMESPQLMSQGGVHFMYRPNTATYLLDEH